ncbi:MAG: VCBS repeat-containing protein [Planctomycetaceae bacterium]
MSCGAMRLLVGFLSWCLVCAAAEAAWPLHTIDRASRGADGVRVADVNRDGLPDLVTGWEEGGQVRVCLNPGPEHVRKPWHSVLVGLVGSPEDAVFVDVDRDGAMDVISSSEGKIRTMHVHWAPRSHSDYLASSAWRTQPLTGSVGLRNWMFCLPMQVDGRHGTDLVAGSKGAAAQIGWWRAPKQPRDLAAWEWLPMCQAGWIMSLRSEDVDEDGDEDVVFSDRKGAGRGCYWLENPGIKGEVTRPWSAHAIGGLGQEVMFLGQADINGDSRADVVGAVRGGDLLAFERTSRRRPEWTTRHIAMPSGVGTGKAVAIADIDRDGRTDCVVSCENAAGRVGVFWLSPPKSASGSDWGFHDISGKHRGVKFDLLRLLDLDHDGDLDVVTCEERDNLGVVWYENPGQRP